MTHENTAEPSVRKLIAVWVQVTIKHLCQRQVSCLGVAVLDVFVRVPGEALPQQRNRESVARRAEITESEGVWEEEGGCGAGRSVTGRM